MRKLLYATTLSLTTLLTGCQNPIINTYHPKTNRSLTQRLRMEKHDTISEYETPSTNHELPFFIDWEKRDQIRKDRIHGVREHRGVSTSEVGIEVTKMGANHLKYYNGKPKKTNRKG